MANCKKTSQIAFLHLSFPLICPFSILPDPQRSADTSRTLISYFSSLWASLLPITFLSFSQSSHAFCFSFSGCFITPLVLLVETDPEHSCTQLSCRHSLRTALSFPAQQSDHSTSHIRSVSLLLSTCSICCSHKVKEEWGKVNEEAQREAESFLLNFRLIWSQNSHLLESLHIEKSRAHNIELFRDHIIV